MTLAVEPPTDFPAPIFVGAKDDPAPCALPARIELDLAKFPGGRWALQLDAVFARREAPVVILAHGIACRAVAWWAQLSPRSYLRAIQGALFHAPLQVGVDQRAAAAAMRSGPAYRLPFASIVISDPSCQVAQTLALADAWGSRFVVPGADIGPPSNRHARFNAVETMLLGQRDWFETDRTPQLQPLAAGERPVAPRRPE